MSRPFETVYRLSTENGTQSDLSTHVDTEEKMDAESQTSYDRKEYADPELENATINVLFSVGVFVLTAVVFIAIGSIRCKDARWC